MPNWKEAFEKVLAKGGEPASKFPECQFCIISGIKNISDTDKCLGCPLCAVLKSPCFSERCWRFLKSYMDNAERRAICRHVLATVKDFTDRDEIRARIAEMLDDDAREKFLGKAKRKEYTVDTGVYIYHYEDKVAGNALRAPNGVTPLRYLIRRAGCFTAAFRDEDTRDRVLAFLNGEAK